MLLEGSGVIRVHAVLAVEIGFMLEGAFSQGCC